MPEQTEVDVSALGAETVSPVVTLADAGDDRVWIQLAECGRFEGHPAGAFELSPQVFSQICANFKRDKLPIPIDMEHASEQEPTEGSIPVSGAPATGWIHSLENRGQGGLWGQVEWLEPAKSYIKEGKYRYLSPAIRFESRDRVTGQPIGARLTSAAVTNQPFLRNMQPLVARDGARTAVYCMSTSMPEKVAEGLEVTVHEPPAMEKTEIHAHMAHHPMEYMNRVRAALKMPDLASPKECADKLERLRDLFAEYGTAKTPDGLDLSDHLMSMRTLTGVGVGGTWENVFDLMEDLIDAAMDKHLIEEHGAGPDMSDKKQPKKEAEPADAGGEGEEDDDEDEESESDTMKASDKQPAAKTPNTSETPGVQGTTPEGINMADEDNKLVLALRDANTQNASLTLDNKNLKHENTLLKAQVERLETVLKTQEEAQLINEVHVAFDTYKDAKKLTLSQREAMMRHARADIDSFRATYPVVPANQRYLMRDVTPPAPKANADLLCSEDGRALTHAELRKKLMSERKMSFADAQNEAVRILRGAR